MWQCLYPTMIVVVVCLGLTQQDALEERELSKVLTVLQFRRPSTACGNLEASGDESRIVDDSDRTLALSSSDLAQSHEDCEDPKKLLHLSPDTQAQDLQSVQIQGR